MGVEQPCTPNRTLLALVDFRFDGFRSDSLGLRDLLSFRGRKIRFRMVQGVLGWVLWLLDVTEKSTRLGRTVGSSQQPTQRLKRSGGFLKLVTGIRRPDFRGPYNNRLA